MIRFSIIIPVYNVEKYLKKCLDSIIYQNYKNYEAIIVCDKCNDKSEEIVDDYVKKYENFKKIYCEKTGLSKARNIGVAEATGEYLLFLDSDDYFEKDLLRELNNNLNKKTDMLRFQVQEIYEEKVIKYLEEDFETQTGIDAFSLITKYHFIEPAWAYCYNTLFFKKNKFKFKENCIAEDFGLFPIIIAKCKTIKSISFIGYNYVQRDNSLMSNKKYESKLKKMNDMIIQADKIKKTLKNTKHIESIISFVNNSLIYYSSTLKYRDYIKYSKILKSKKCYDHLKNDSLKHTIRNLLLKLNSYYYYKWRK